MAEKRFPIEVLNEAKQYFSDREFTKRRRVSGYTIDGPHSKDLDDGFDIRMNGRNYLLEISIADVASAVRPGTKIFDEALERVETQYLALFNVPMIPRVLSENRLSLLPGGLRPAITYTMEVTPECEVVSFAMEETAFTSIRKLDYDEFDGILINNPEDPDYEKFALAAELARNLIKLRRSHGALVIYDLMKGLYTNEEGVVMAAEKSARYISHLVIQELMVLTNTTIASYFARNGLLFLFRNHTARIGAPQRGEMFEQITVAIRDAEFLNYVQNQASVWFNRAEYSPRLLGHFGLNLQAYAHCTSPIRRAADLLNQLLIKAHINGIDTPFSQAYLEGTSSHINEVIFANKESKASYLKDKAMRNAIGQLRSSTDSDMLMMDYANFEAVAVAAAKSGEMNDYLRTALLLNLEENKIDYYLAYVLLFVAPDDGEAWTELRELALLYIHKRKGFPNQMLTILETKMGVGVEINVQPTQGKNFSSIVKLFKDGNEFATPEPKINRKKKNAVHFAACDAIRVFLGIREEVFDDATTELVEDETGAENQESENALFGFEDSIDRETLDLLKEKYRANLKSEPSIKAQSVVYDATSEAENYVGQLLELVNTTSRLGQPEYIFGIDGESHKPVITCICSINLDGSLIQEMAQGQTKKQAKQSASRIVLEMLACKGIEKDKSDPAQNFDRVEVSGANFVGMLMDFCAQKKIKSPKFEFIDRSTRGDSAFECIVTVRSHGTDYSVPGFGRDKKTAKQNAAEAAIGLYNELSTAGKGVDDHES